ncbi:hypothetical protein A3860_13360 [Niastella vici]|uniref:Uncharacterized protein n=1 Tax=Niastella vici TaxID=1703345 RepID=A0A1V9G7B9_9BACT|nr:hypothetical protein A3860_13360 [Niastella vici]
MSKCFRWLYFLKHNSFNIFKRKEQFTMYPARPNNNQFSIKTTFNAFITIPNQKKFNKIQ